MRLSAKQRLERIRRSPKKPWIVAMAAVGIVMLGSIFWGGMHGNHAIAKHADASLIGGTGSNK